MTIHIQFRPGLNFAVRRVLPGRKPTGAGLRSGGQIDSHYGVICFQITNGHSNSSYHAIREKESAGSMTDDTAGRIAWSIISADGC
jgi:hypothetical protein